MTYTRYRPSWRNEADPLHPAPGATAMDAGWATKVEDTFVSQDARITTLETSGTGVPTSRHINTDSTMSGGGDLTADRTLAVLPNTTNQKLQIAKSGTVTGTRKQINLIPGANVAITTADNSTTDAVDVTISSSGSSGGIPTSTVTAKGDLIGATGSAAVTNVPVGTQNSILCADSAQTAGIGWKALSTILQAILTTKGDLLTSNSSIAGRLAVGTDNQVLTADSTKTVGIKWATPAASIPPSAFTALGDLLVGTGAGTYNTFPLAFTDGQVLKANSAVSPGVVWDDIVKAPVTITFTPTVSTNASLSNSFRFTATSNFTLANPITPTDGQVITWEIIQDGTGSRIMTLDTMFVFGTTITSATLTTTASKRDFLVCRYTQSTNKMYVINFIKGF